LDSGAFEELVGPRLSTATFSTAGFIRTVVSKSWIAGACVDGKVYIWLRYPESNEETGIERVAVITSSGILPNNTADDRKNQDDIVEALTLEEDYLTIAFSCRVKASNMRSKRKPKISVFSLHKFDHIKKLGDLPLCFKHEITKITSLTTNLEHRGKIALTCTCDDNFGLGLVFNFLSDPHSISSEIEGGCSQ
jgi:hypothetical protein